MESQSPKSPAPKDQQNSLETQGEALAEKTETSPIAQGPAMQNPRWLWWGMGLLVLFAMGSTAIALQGM